MIIEDDNFLTVRSKNYIDKIMSTGSDFPYFYSADSVNAGDGCDYMVHVFLSRSNSLYDKEKWNSSFCTELRKLALDFIRKHNIKLKKFLRGAVNYTYFNGKKLSGKHRDHNFPHHQLLIYLNNPEDTKSATVIIDENDKEVRVYPQKFKAVFFDDRDHWIELPQTGHRVVAVFTMLIDDIDNIYT